MITNGYKARTTKDKQDTNIPLSVQPWGRDGDRRRYWLVEGQNDTHFRIYRESDPKAKDVQWISVAGNIEELRVLATRLEEEDGHKDAKALAERMLNAVPRFEASENVSVTSLPHDAYADNSIEAQATRLHTPAQRRLHKTRARLLPLRRPHPWQAPAIQLR
jgi:hypothetical protein